MGTILTRPNLYPIFQIQNKYTNKVGFTLADFHVEVNC